jgi:hypothetical protein
MTRGARASEPAGWVLTELSLAAALPLMSQQASRAFLRPTPHSPIENGRRGISVHVVWARPELSAWAFLGMSRTLRYFGTPLVALTVLLVAPRDSEAASPSRDTTASELKAAFLVNFIRFVEWPPTVLAEQVTITVGIVGDDPFERTLDDAVAGKKIGGRDVRIARLGANDNFAGVHLLFIGGSEKGHIRDILQRVGTSSVLTVSDVGGFCDNGGVIELVVSNDRLRSEVNLAAARRVNLQVSSKLLALAKTVRDPK